MKMFFENPIIPISQCKNYNFGKTSATVTLSQFYFQIAPAVILIPSDDFVAVDPLIWWDNIKIQQPLRGKMSNLSNQLFTISPTTAPREEIFFQIWFSPVKIKQQTLN